MRAALAAVLALSVWGAAPGVLADEIDYLTTWGKLTDTDFYRLVSCRALPGAACRDPVVRWSASRARDLHVRLEPAPPEVPKALARDLQAALDQAIAQVNGVGAALALRLVGPDDRADIRVFVTRAGNQQPIAGTGIPGIDGVVIGAGLATVWWDADRHLTEAVIVLAGDLPAPERQPVMLEELTQTLGFLTDIRNPLYNDQSVFSEDSNTVTRLGPQDVMAIRRHYP